MSTKIQNLGLSKMKKLFSGSQKFFTNSKLSWLCRGGLDLHKYAKEKSKCKRNRGKNRKIHILQFNSKFRFYIFTYIIEKILSYFRLF